MIDISVIVPVYNVEDLLPRCIESIMSQTKKSLEIILVNDGATDNSGAVCDEYAKKDERIRVIHKPNGGLTSAWKAGAEIATGRYLGFVDSDDWIDEDMYKRMWESACKYNSDIVVCGLVFDYEDTSIPKRNEISEFEKEYYSRKELEELFPVLINDGRFFGRKLQPARVTKLYRKELVDANMPLCKEEVSVGEDMQLTLPALMDAKSMSVVKDFYPYHYWFNQKSMTGKYDPKYLDKIKIMAKRMKEISRDLGYTREHITRVFKAAFRVTPKQYSEMKRFGLALEKLRDGEKIGSVSHQLEFSSPYSFSKAFKKQFGYSPKQYISLIEKKNHR